MVLSPHLLNGGPLYFQGENEFHELVYGPLFFLKIETFDGFAVSGQFLLRVLHRQL